MSCIDMGNSICALLINILLGSFQLFLHSDQPLSEGEIIPFSGVCQSGEAAIIHAGGSGGLYWPQRAFFDVQPTTTSVTASSQSIIFSFSINQLLPCILHRAQQHHADASTYTVIAAFASFSSLAFLSRWAL